MSATDTYSCPVDDCDYEIFAVGLQDPDEPDYFTEDIEQHKRGHVVESQHIDSATHASSSQAGLASLIPSTGVVTDHAPAPVDAATPDWDAMADAYGPVCAACEGDDDASHVADCRWIAAQRPSLVQLDYAEAAAKVAATSHALIMLPAEVDRAALDAAFAAARAALDELEEASR